MHVIIFVIIKNILAFNYFHLAVTLNLYIWPFICGLYVLIYYLYRLFKNANFSLKCIHKYTSWTYVII